nr:reverse transcriptase domain-containing protein [Tanacetum cinerariifolium]
MVDSGSIESGVKHLLGSVVWAMMSPGGSIVASLENVNGFLVVYTPSDDLIYTDFEKKGVVPEVMLHILEEFDFLLGRHSLDNKIPCMVVCKVDKPWGKDDWRPEVELKDLTPHLEYTFLEGDDKLPVIIAKDLSVEEKTALITVLKSHKRAISWKLSDIKATRKDHFPLSFMDKILERLAGNQYYCFLNGFSGYFQIPIDPKDQEKTTFTCPYGTFAYRHMSFGLCNSPGTFQRCMMVIFHDLIEKTLEVFMDDFSVFRNSFQSCLSHLERMLKRCEDTNLCLNREKSQFMVKEGIVLGHKISKQGIEVDKAKVDVITKLPHPTTVKGLGQCQAKHFRPIHYASKTMTEAESNTTTTEKEMLAVVYAFEKFLSYLIMNKSIVYTDHSALKCIFAKRDSKAILI